MIRKLLVIHHSNVANHFSKSLALTLSPSRKEKRKKEFIFNGIFFLFILVGMFYFK
jgi:hypothetical protein